MRRIGFAQVAVQGAQHGGGRRHERILAREQARQVPPGEHAGGRGLRVPLDPRELTREQDLRVVPGREMGCERLRRIDVRVAVDAAVAQELRVREARDETQHALLLGDPHPRLKSHQVPHLRGPVFLAELHHGERDPAGAGVRAGRRASWARTAACRGRDAPFPRPGGSLRSRVRDRSRAAVRTGRRCRAPRAVHRTRAR